MISAGVNPLGLPGRRQATLRARRAGGLHSATGEPAPCDPVRRTHGRRITPTQWAALSKLHGSADTQSRLGRMTAMDVATIKGVVDRLMKRSFVRSTADEGDARRRFLALSDEGRAFARQILPVSREITRETLGPLTKREQADLRGPIGEVAISWNIPHPCSAPPASKRRPPRDCAVVGFHKGTMFSSGRCCFVLERDDMGRIGDCQIGAVLVQGLAHN